MDRLARIVIGYHGCDPAFAEALIRGEIKIDDWKPSQNDYDWLGHGIYFWECGPRRAREWGRGGVIGALIQLGTCLDLTDLEFTELLADEYEAVREIHRSKGLTLPENRLGRRELDCLVINELITTAERTGIAFQTVRCPFLDGDPAFPGSLLLRESHIQVAVRDIDCIIGVFRPNFT